MEGRIKRFRRQVEEHFGGRPGRGARYPEALRAEALELAADLLARGKRRGAVAEGLGLRIETLRRWMDTARPRGGPLRAVEVVETEAESEAGSGGHLVLVTAAGHRVEGLKLAEAALLLEALG